MNNVRLVRSRVAKAPSLLQISDNSKPLERDLRSEAISAYRGLLRATTYLPDSIVRKYVFARIRNRFRADKERIALREDKARRDLTIQRLVKARRRRRLLEDAADGDMDALKKVFLQVHGREGARKRWLIKYLLEPDEKALPKDASALQMVIEREPTSIAKGPPDPKLLSFIKSQQANQPVDAHNGKIRQFQAKIPKENIWARPTPISMQKKYLQKWWITTLEKVLPPIPRDEWERLRDLATGILPLEARPARRTALISPKEEVSEEERSAELLQYFQMPARHHPSRNLMKVAIQKGQDLEAPVPTTEEEKFHLAKEDAPYLLEKAEKVHQKNQKNRLKREKGADDKVKYEGAHLRPTRIPSDEGEIELRSRSLRRLYATIWSLTPTMAYDEVNRKWDIEWGGQRSRALEGAISKPSLAEEELFEGLGTLPQNLNTSGVKSKVQKINEVNKGTKETASEQQSDAKLRKYIGMQNSQNETTSGNHGERRLKVTRRPV
ncbi:hypothetical protein WAI453_010685 [Rhynchosporium graminicola]